MKACHRLENLLAAHALGELAEQDTHTLEKHLADCARCRSELFQMQAVLAVADAMKAETASKPMQAQAAQTLRTVPAAGPTGAPAFQGKTVKSYMIKSAAAVIIVAVLVGLYSLTGSIDGASIAFADVIKAMENVSWLHQTSKGFEGNVSGTGEQWIGFKSKIHAAKSADGKMSYWNITEQKRYEYDPQNKYITLTDTAGTDAPFSLNSATTMLDGIHKMLVEQGAEVLTEPAQYNGRKVQLQQFLLSVGVQSQQLKLYIDLKSKMLVAAEITVKDAAGTVLMDGVATFSYPASGPATIYDLGVPKETPIKADGRSNQFGMENRIRQIDQLETWPEPLEMVQQYWLARNNREYEKTRLYWPNSEQWDEKLIATETPTEYVFGKPSSVTSTSLNIPYDSREHYQKTQDFRFIMVLSKKYSEKGRYYIVSGN